MRLALLLSLLLVTACNAQLQVDITSGYRIEGLSAVNLLPDGKVISATPPKAVLPQGTLTVSGVKTALVRAYDAETGKRVAIEKTGPFSWAWTSPKKVDVEITYVDDAGNLQSDDRTIELPDDPEPTPTPAPDANDSEFVKATRATVTEFVNGMASDWDLTAKGIREGKYKNLVEAANDNKQRDDKTRILFKQQLSKLMQPKLGDGPLVDGADKVFDDLATGFRGAVK